MYLPFTCTAIYPSRLFCWVLNLVSCYYIISIVFFLMVKQFSASCFSRHNYHLWNCKRYSVYIRFDVVSSLTTRWNIHPIFQVDVHLSNTVSHSALRPAVAAVCPAVAPTMQLLTVLLAVWTENAAAPQACPETVVGPVQHGEICTLWQSCWPAVTQFLGHPGPFHWGELLPELTLVCQGSWG